MDCRKVLLIDDDPALTTVLARRIEFEFEVETAVANDPLHAVQSLVLTDPDVVICDVRMPSGNGLGICEMMDASPRWRNIPVIVLTGLSDGNTLRRVANVDAYYVNKTAHLWLDLKPVIEQALGLPASLVLAGESNTEPQLL